MPNWVFNTLTVEGEPSTVEKLRQQVSQSFTEPVQANGDLAFSVEDKVWDNPKFAFWNIVAPTDLEAYPKQPPTSDLDSSDPNWWADINAKAKTDNSWYNWNLRNWGVKWDVAGTSELVHDEPNGENHVLVYQFDTAWGIAGEAMQKLSEQYPTLLFTLEYEEEQGWGGEIEFVNGKIMTESEYDSKCHDCGAIDTIEYCEDCAENLCSKCNWLGEADLESVAGCDIHKVYLETNVPEYRKVSK